jgi:hypothetical protein
LREIEREKKKRGADGIRAIASSKGGQKAPGQRGTACVPGDPHTKYSIPPLVGDTTLQLCRAPRPKITIGEDR